MDAKQTVEQAKTKLEATKARFEEDLKKLRTGRAHPSMLDSVMVEAYGSPMPLIQVGTVSTPESQLIQITPFDPNNLQAITTAIRDNQSLGLNPMDDGRVVRIPIPPLTTERRQQIVKQLGEKTEECMISMRNVRHDAMKELDQAKKDKSIGEDEQKRFQKQIDDLMSETKIKVEQLAKTKETEIMTM